MACIKISQNRKNNNNIKKNLGISYFNVHKLFKQLTYFKDNIKFFYKLSSFNLTLSNFLGKKEAYEEA